VSLANFKTEKNYTNYIVLFFRTFLFTFAFFAQVKVKAGEWTVDLSRRQTEFTKIQNTRMPASNIDVVQKKNISEDSEIVKALKNAVQPVVPSQEIVIMQTETGFVPATLSLKKNEVYQIHIVNLNSKEKNVSFLMDAFSQSHNTVFGVTKTFTIQPQVEGVFSYQSPETGASGKLVIVSPVSSSVSRQMASEK
jgi:Cupredoxin-like domain